MLPETLEKFKTSGKQLSSQEVVEAYLSKRRLLLEAWLTSPSADNDGREQLYRQVKGLDAIMDQLISGWK